MQAGFDSLKSCNDIGWVIALYKHKECNLWKCADPEYKDESVPFHNVKLKTDLVSGTVVVRPELTVKGVSMLLGNDLAGGKVLSEPIVSNSPCTEVVPKKDKDIFLFV